MSFRSTLQKTKMPLAVLFLFFTGVFGLRYFSQPILSKISFSKVFYDRHGSLLRVTLSGDQKYRIHTSFQEIDPAFVETVLLQEDRFFYLHPGVNPVALVKAAWDTFAVGRRRGASTISMQLVRLLEKENTRSLSRKSSQILKALQLELLHSKDEILEAYLNLVPMGGNIEGVSAASLIYFGKAPTKLRLAERLSLALIPQSPSQRGFHTTSNASEDWKTRRSLLFNSWIERHPSDKKQIIEVERELPHQKRHQLPFEAPHFTQELASRYPDKHTFKSSLDLRLQNFIESMTRNYIRGKKDIGLTNTSVMLLNYKTGEVLAYLGSADFADNSISGQVDGIQALRSPGSALKPFVYALALEEGLIHSQSLLRDTPKSFGAFDPENFDQSFLGPLSASDALIHSRNIPAVTLNSELKKVSLYSFLKQQGFYLPRNENYYGLGLTLGGAEVSMENLLRIYAGLARRKALRALNYLSTESRFPTLSNPQDGSWPISPESAWITLDMLSHNPRSKSVNIEKWSTQRLNIAWKTGTSSGFRDAWTLGIFGPYALGVWVGNFSGEGNPSFLGRQAAAPLFFELAEGLWKRERFDSLASWNNESPELNIKQSEVCSVSGAFPEPHCPHRKMGWIIPGKSPIAHCSIHHNFLVHQNTGKRACPQSPIGSSYQPKTFEVWPSDLLKAYESFGIHKSPLPSFEESCANLNHEELHLGRSPEIVSPRKDVTYALKLSEAAEKHLIPLQAIAEGNSQKLNWFSGREYLGESPADKPLFWKARRGKHLITVVDEQGRTESQWLEVKYVP